MRTLPAIMVSLSLTLVACEPLEDTAPATDNEPLETMNQEVSLPPLWSEADGERTFTCKTKNGFQELHITLPPWSPHTDEFNALNAEVSGGAPFDVISTVYFEHGKILEDLDESDWLQNITLVTPEGERVLDARDNELGFYLWENLNYGHHVADANTNARRRALRENVAADEWTDGGRTRTGVRYYITERPLTQVNSITVKWGWSADCVPLNGD